MGNGARKIIAAICTIALVISSMAIYKREVVNADEEPIDLVTDCVTSEEFSVIGFQIKVNDNDTSARTGFRVVAKIPKSGTVKDTNGVEHTVDHFGTVYALDDNDTGLKENNVYNKNYTILNGEGVSGEEWEFEGINNGSRTVGYAVTDEAFLPNWTPKDEKYDYYAMTMMDVDSAILEHTIFVRPYFVDENGNIIYASQVVSTSIAQVANDLYINSKMPNVVAHNYLYDNILHSSYTQHNCYHLDSPQEYGWGGGIYAPDSE